MKLVGVSKLLSVNLEYIIGYFQNKTNDVFTFFDIINLFHILSIKIHSIGNKGVLG